MTTKEKKYINFGGYMALPDSKRLDIGDSIIFSCDALQTVFVYKRGFKTPVETFQGELNEYHEKVADLINKAKQVEICKQTLKASHTLTIGTVMACHTNVKDPAVDVVRFFQIEDVLACGEVSFYELLADTIAFKGCKQSIPLIGMKIGTLKKSTVLVDTITIDRNLIGKKLDYKLINLDGVELKVYKPQNHSLFS